MPAKVTLTVIKGPLAGQEYTFEERTTCLIGRGGECQAQVPNDEQHVVISRTHCLLDINPPDVRVRDLGSLNGTLVNGNKVGQRKKGQSREEAVQEVLPEYDLKDGDEIGLMHTVFRVDVYVPAHCNDCTVEIPAEERAACERAPRVYRCDPCQKKAEAAGRKAPPVKKVPVCSMCRKDVSNEVDADRTGTIICSACRAEPNLLLRALLLRAMQGDPIVSSIRGYNIVRELGRGGMGAVYLVTQAETGKQVALKVMLPRVAADPNSVGHFLRELEVMKTLDHPNVAQLHDFGCSNGTFFFTTEFCPGGSVDQFMGRRGGTLSVDEACHIMFNVLDGLEYSHHAEVRVKLKDGSYTEKQGVVHRDLSPQNMLLSSMDRSAVAKVSDFGLAKSFDAAGLSGQTMTGMIMGKPAFMPRQQVINFNLAKPEVDVWAAAASLYNMLTGSVPRDFLPGKSPWQVILNTDSVPIRCRKASIPANLAEVIDAALVDRPEIRIRIASELKRMLEGAL